jgi:Transmembrane secretion effector
MTADASSSPRPSRGGGLLRHRDLRLLPAGQAVSELGSQVGGIALPLVAVLSLEASPVQVGVLTAAGTISFAVLALPAGVWVDRLPRRPVLVGADLVRGAALLTVPVAAALGRLTLAQLVVVALAVGVAPGAVRRGLSQLPARPGRAGGAGPGQRLAGVVPVGHPAHRPGTGRLAGAAGRRPGGRGCRRGQLPGLGRTGGLVAALAATRVGSRAADTSRPIWLPVTVTAPFALCTPLTAPGWRVVLFPVGVAVTSFGQVPTTSPRSATGRRCARPACSAA